MLIRKCISEYCEREGCRSGVVIDVDNRVSHEAVDDGCYLVADGSMVFGICLRNGCIFTEVIHEDDLPGDRRVLASKQEFECFVQSCENPRWKEYQAVVDYDSGRYIRTSLDQNGCGSIGDVKSCDLFWGFTKGRLMKFNGISKSTLYFHLKECEFRFNHRNENLYKLLLKIMRENPLN